MTTEFNLLCHEVSKYIKRRACQFVQRNDLLPFLVNDEGKKHYFPHPAMINYGLCEEFATEVVDYFHHDKEINLEEVWIEDQDSELEDYSHCVVKFERHGEVRYFDSENPDGVEDLKDLSVVVKANSKMTREDVLRTRPAGYTFDLIRIEQPVSSRKQIKGFWMDATATHPSIIISNDGYGWHLACSTALPSQFDDARRLHRLNEAAFQCYDLFLKNKVQADDEILIFPD